MGELTPEQKAHIKALCNVFIANANAFSDAVEECLVPAQMLTLSHLERLPSGAQIRLVYSGKKGDKGEPA